MKLNTKLYKRLLLINRPSGQEEEMISFIINYCYKIPHLTFNIDSKKNIFITKTTYSPVYVPCICCHMDTVFNFGPQRELVIKDGVVTARYISTKTQCGLGADDANGILCALQLLEVLPDIKVIFTVEEECGATGAETAVENIDFFNNISFFLQADRRGNKDLIVHTNGIESASSRFLDDIKDIKEQYGYVNNHGTFTDVGVFAEFYERSGVNISCGYYSEHTSNERCVLKELQNCLNFMYDIITNLMYVVSPYEIKVQKYYSAHSSKNIEPSPKETDPYYDDSDYYGYYRDPCAGCKTFDCMHCTKAW